MFFIKLGCTWMEKKKLHELQEGDRFYLADDTRRHVWQLDWMEERERINFFGRVVTYRVFNLVDDAKKKKEETSDVSVIYIRNVNKKAAKRRPYVTISCLQTFYFFSGSGPWLLISGDVV